MLLMRKHGKERAHKRYNIDEELIGQTQTANLSRDLQDEEDAFSMQFKQQLFYQFTNVPQTIPPLIIFITSRPFGQRISCFMGSFRLTFIGWYNIKPEKNVVSRYH